MIKTKKLILSVVALVVMAVSMVVVSTVDAQFSPDNTMGVELQVQGDSSVDLAGTILAVIKGLLSVVFVVAVLMFVVAGLFFLTAAGTDRADTARDIITYAIIGLVVSVLGYAVVVFLSNALKN